MPVEKAEDLTLSDGNNSKRQNVHPVITIIVTSNVHG